MIEEEVALTQMDLHVRYGSVRIEQQGWNV